MRVFCATRPTPRVLHACALFGLHAVRAEARRDEPDVAGVVQLVFPGRIVLLTGPSGGGKSTALRAVVCALRRHGTRVQTPPSSYRGRLSRTIVDLIPGTVEQALCVLARAGLAEPRLFARTPDELSDGQRVRFEVACAMSRARPGSIVAIDEFCSTLDRATARGVAGLVARWIRRRRTVGLLCATAHDDIERWLEPDAVARIGMTGDIVIRSSPGEDG